MRVLLIRQDIDGSLDEIDVIPLKDRLEEYTDEELIKIIVEANELEDSHFGIDNPKAFVEENFEYSVRYIKIR